MIQVANGLWVGNGSDCRRGSSEMAVVHACKSPCHQTAVGYSASLPLHHPNYLQLETDFDIFLNIIDPPVPLFKHETFASFL